MSQGSPARLYVPLLIAVVLMDTFMAVDGRALGGEGVAPTSDGNGIVCDGETDTTAAIQAEIDAGRSVVLPVGTCLVTRQITVHEDGVHIEGAGPHATHIRFAPTEADSPQTLLLFEEDEVQNPGDDRDPNLILLWSGLREVSLGSGKSTPPGVAKVALDVHDARHFTMDNVVIRPWTTGRADDEDPDGAGDDPVSVGLRVRGRDNGTYRKLHIEADLPIEIAGNDRDFTKDLDHHHFEDLTLVSNVPPDPVIRVDSGAVLRQVTFDGYQAWVHGGFEWIDGDVVPRRESNHVRIANVRAEGIICPKGTPPRCPEVERWAIRIEKHASAKLTEFLVDFSLLGGQGIEAPFPATWKDVRVMGVERTVLRQVVHTGRKLVVEGDGKVIRDP